MVRMPDYTILGRGRWAQRMTKILIGENRGVSAVLETRRRTGEGNADFRARLSSVLAASRAQIAWLCVPPGPHVLPMLEACVDSGVHAIVEKPWFCSAEETQFIQKLAKETGIHIGVHYEYCLLDEVAVWRKNLYPGSGLAFSGRFYLSRSNHLGISSLDNLGSHLLSIRAFAVPESRISEFECAYEMPDQRQVWIEKEGQRIESLDLLAHTQPVIQRFITKFEAALEGAAFELDLSFALRVAADVAALVK